ncbi:unnamed protein product [Protopolystoma xenopodis]|uniref:Uncharacterized protein n=1 Tax=Protopolystoma xenopodis TaxID=117903 RepID=A0A3S5A4N1_9PLAT|nr:unnamed protein product [Protopolystoma xenopodis]
MDHSNKLISSEIQDWCVDQILLNQGHAVRPNPAASLGIIQSAPSIRFENNTALFLFTLPPSTSCPQIYPNISKALIKWSAHRACIYPSRSLGFTTSNPIAQPPADMWLVLTNPSIKKQSCEIFAHPCLLERDASINSDLLSCMCLPQPRGTRDFRNHTLVRETNQDARHRTPSRQMQIGETKVLGNIYFNMKPGKGFFCNTARKCAKCLRAPFLVDTSYSR